MLQSVKTWLFGVDLKDGKSDDKEKQTSHKEDPCVERRKSEMKEVLVIHTEDETLVNATVQAASFLSESLQYCGISTEKKK